MLSYCTNVHPCDSYNDLLKLLVRQCAGVRRAMGSDQLAIGMFFPAQAARWLAGKDKARAALIETMVACGLVTTTANAFPFTAFHAPKVKDAVYRPSWREVRRREHTLRVARVMASLIGPEQVASVSTVPLGWHEEFVDVAAREEAARELALFAWQVRQEVAPMADGRPRLRLGLEPEPYTALSNARETVEFFRDVLWEVGEDVISSEKGVTRADARRILRETIGVCIDACHASVVFERPRDMLELMRESGIPVVKVQLSNAIEIRDAVGAKALAAFAEDRYLHQTWVRETGGGLQSFPDLPEALAHIDRRSGGAFSARCHFHVPVTFAGAPNGIGTTQAELLDLITALAEELRHGRFDGDLEVETYTWDVLPRAYRKGELVDGIAAELKWVRAAFAAQGVTV